MLRQLHLIPLLVIPIATGIFVTSHDIVNFSWLEFGERDVPPPIVETFEMKSTNTGKSYSIHVQLPGNYRESTSAYPVIYVIAPSPFPEGYATILTPLLKRSQIPDLIVVSVSPPSSPRSRRRGPFSGSPAASARWTDDLTLTSQGYVNAQPQGGKAAAFVGFFEHELFPKIEQQYRTTPGDRALAGRGVGGVFVVETALTRPELFAKYLSLAPSAQWDDFHPARLASEKMRMGFDPDIRLYIAAASDDTSTLVIGFDRLKKALDLGTREQFKVHAEVLGGRNHDSIVVPGAQQGLLYLYGN